MEQRLSGRVAIITGAGRNIGEATSRLFADEGASVALADVDDDRGARVEAVINASHPGVARYMRADVSNEAQVKSLVSGTVDTFGRVDVLVNGVAISDNKNVRDCTLQEFERTVAITMTSQFLTSKWAAEQMIAQGDGGVIVNIGSTSGFRGRDRAIAYSAAKGGVANLTRALAVQLAPYGIRVNSVVPNKIGSPVGKEEFDPTRPVSNLTGRGGLPEELANVLLFLASDESSFVMGENLFVDGGHSAMAH